MAYVVWDARLSLNQLREIDDEQLAAIQERLSEFWFDLKTELLIVEE